MTTDTPLPPDPVQYDAERNVHARRLGMPHPYIPGGVDPDLPVTLARERRYLRLLVGMAIGIVAMGFVLGIMAALVAAPAV